MEQMIEIECQSCQSRIRVPADAAGRRGVCPSCRAELAVPHDEAPMPTTPHDDARPPGGPLHELCERVAERLGSRVRGYRLMGGRLLTFEVVTDERTNRTQRVHLSETRDQAGEAALLIHSTVGTIFRHEQAVEALKSAAADPTLNVSLDDENVLAVRVFCPGVIDVDPARLAARMLRVGRVADTMEESLFRWDRA